MFVFSSAVRKNPGPHAMSDDEDADANEQAFAELQENLQEQEDAENASGKG